MVVLHSLYHIVSGAHTGVLDEMANKVDKESHCCKRGDDIEGHKGVTKKLKLAEHRL